MNKQLLISHLLRALAFLLLIFYAAFFIFREVPHTGLLPVHFLVLPLILSLVCVISSRYMKLSEKHAYKLRRNLSSGLILSLSSLALVGIAFKSGMISNYEVWLKYGMVEKPKEGNLYLMFSIFIGLLISAVSPPILPPRK